MDIFTKHPIAWGFISFCLFALFYAMTIIKKEKSIFLKSPKLFRIGPYQLLTPKWWTEKISTNKLKFTRTDTRYDWMAVFFWTSLTKVQKDQSLKEILAGYINAKKILFDANEAIVEVFEDQDFFQDDHFKKLIFEGKVKVLKVEGPATKDLENRIYYQALIIKNSKEEFYLLCENESSILNGSVEGPYFEEAIKNLRMSS